MNALALGNEMGGSRGRGYSVSSVVTVEVLSGFATKKYCINFNAVKCKYLMEL